MGIGCPVTILPVTTQILLNKAIEGKKTYLEHKDNSQSTTTTTIFRFNIARLTSVIHETDVNKSAVAFL